MSAPDFQQVLKDNVKVARLVSLRSSVVPILANQLQTEFTDHSVEHSDRVASLVVNLVSPLLSRTECLTDREWFVIFAACYLHDFGMQFEASEKTRTIQDYCKSSEWKNMPREQRAVALRVVHHKLSAELVRASVRSGTPPIGFLLNEQDDPGVIAALCEAHATDTEDPRYSSLMDEGNSGVRTALLSGLLRMADILDATQRRALRPKARSLILSSEASVHWWLHYYAKEVVFDLGKKVITLVFEFPAGKKATYEDSVVSLHFPEIQHEYRRHEEVFAQNSLVWVIKRLTTETLYLDAEDMPDDIFVIIRARHASISPDVNRTNAVPSQTTAFYESRGADAPKAPSTHAADAVKLPVHATESITQCSDDPWVPGELKECSYPIGSLMRDGRLRGQYQALEQKALRNLGYTKSASHIEAMQWVVTLTTLGYLVDEMLEQQPNKQHRLQELASAWSARFLDHNYERQLNSVALGTRLFTLNDGKYVPINDAISAYLDGLSVATSVEASQGWGQLVAALVDVARSRRRLPTGVRRPTAAVVNWLALMVVVYVDDQKGSRLLIDLVSSRDLSIAQDLSALFYVRWADAPSTQSNAIDRLSRFVQRHGGSRPQLFGSNLDKASNSSRLYYSRGEMTIDSTEAQDLIEAIRDSDVLTCLLAAAAIPENRSLTNPSLWDAVVPAHIRGALADLGRKLFTDTIELVSSHVFGVHPVCETGS